MKLSSVFVCQLLIGLVCSEFDLSDWIKNQNAQKDNITPTFPPTLEPDTTSTTTTTMTTPKYCDPYGSECRTVFVSADMPRMVRDYADIVGRYIVNLDQSVPWAPERPVYQRASRHRSFAIR